MNTADENQPSRAQDEVEQTASAPDEQPSGDEFPIVGIGASAGGLEAFTQFLSHLPSDTGMAFALVQHLDPAHASQRPPRCRWSK